MPVSYLRDLVCRLHRGESERQIAADLRLSRHTVHKYYEWAEGQGLLLVDSAVPDNKTLAAALGPSHEPPKVESSVEEYREVVERLLGQSADLVFDQKTPTCIACHRQAFESFGGVPRRVVPDNLKPAVLVAALHDPVPGEDHRRMPPHYDYVVSPTRPGEGGTRATMRCATIASPCKFDSTASPHQVAR